MSESPISPADGDDFASLSGIEVTGDDDPGVIVDVEPVDTTVTADSPAAPGEDADVTVPDAAVTLYEVDEPGDPVRPLVEEG